jgi:DNA-binding beta-propeller fold protein YncE
LHVIDTGADAQGFPANTLSAAVEICREASGVVAADLGAGDRAWVTCFGAGQLWAVDPVRGEAHMATTVGRGPFAVKVAASRKRLYVSNFLDDTIAVLDVEPGSPTENRVVLRIGIPRESE